MRIPKDPTYAVQIYRMAMHKLSARLRIEQAITELLFASAVSFI